jgi:predicted SprT family Zn-dependent metalloprotease
MTVNLDALARHAQKQANVLARRYRIDAPTFKVRCEPIGDGTAGMASWTGRAFVLRIDPYVVNNMGTAAAEHVIDHEVCHLVTMAREHEQGWMFDDDHGPEWCDAMRHLGRPARRVMWL